MKKKIFAVSAIVISLASINANASGAGYGSAPSNSGASYGVPAQSDSSAHYGPSSQSGAHYGVPLPHVSITPNFDHRRRSSTYWVEVRAGQPLPSRKVIGGNQPNFPRTLYVCHGDYRGGVHPGKLVAGKCNITWGGREIVLDQYEVLVQRGPVAWVPASNGYIPENAIAGGYEGSKTLYICQANSHGGVHTGKVVGSNCNFGWGGNEFVEPSYRVLTST